MAEHTFKALESDPHMLPGAYMNYRLRMTPGVIACIWMSLSVAFSGYARAQSRTPSAVQKEAVVTTHARGTFDITMTPQSTVDTAAGATLGRMSIEKQYHGDLEASGKGEMLTSRTGVAGSAAYVAIERVSGTLHGRRGTFVLQHTGTMTRGTQQLTIAVVPDSGTDQLVGLAGTLVITIANGRHSYDFEYTIAGSP